MYCICIDLLYCLYPNYSITCLQIISQFQFFFPRPWNEAMCAKLCLTQWLAVN